MTDKKATLQAVDVFSDFPPEFVERCAAAAELKSYAPGEVVIEQDQPATAFFVITRGALEVVRDQPPARPVVLTTLGPGRFFGEMALLREAARTATVRAAEDSECLVLEKSAFDVELRRDPNTAAVLATRLARRINMLTRSVVPGPEQP
jgi:CRP-like cAMP-binding protein